MSKTFAVNVTDLQDEDWIMLQAVQTNARVSFAELGRRCGLSAPATAERLRRLQDRGVIRGYHARLDLDRLGLPMQVFVEIGVKRADYLRFQREIANIPWVLECHHIAGRARVQDFDPG